MIAACTGADKHALKSIPRSFGLLFLVWETKNSCGTIWRSTSVSSQVCKPVFLNFPYNPRVGKKNDERDECNLTAHNIPFPILCSTFSVILSQLKNCLMLMHSDLEIKHQSGSLLVDSVGLHVYFYTNSLLQAIYLCLEYLSISVYFVNLALDKQQMSCTLLVIYF